MAYIGKAPNTAIVNQATSQSFSGNGSTTAFTLTRSVNVGEDLEVFVNNVQQEPGSGKSYTASGTTLTFDEAPPSGTNNVYVIYRGEATINPRLEHDANAALAATTGAFSGDLTVETNSTIEMVGGSSKLLFKRPDTTTIAGNPLGAIEFSHTDTNDAGTAAKIIGEGDGSSGEGRLAFHTGTPSALSERLRITGDKVQFNVDAKVDTDNSHDLGASGARWKDLYLSGGMYVGGTTASHHFDDYEEGEFDVTTARSGVTGADDSNATRTAQYVKIGRMVFIDFTRKGSTAPYFKNGTGGYASGQSVTITSNLPFTPNSSNSERLGWSRALSDYDSLAVGWRNGSTTIYLGTGDDNNYVAHNNATTSTSQSNVTIQCQFCYFTTS